MRWLVLTPFTRFGYEKLARFLRSTSYRTYVPLPRDLCLGLQPANLPASFVEIWEPLLDLIWENAVFAECYLTREDLINQINNSLEIALLVFKYKVYGKLDISEWLSRIPRKLEPKLKNWSGILVIDRFVDYVTLLRSNINIEKVLAVDAFAPTPLELLILTANDLINWTCGIESIIQWIIKYIGEIILLSSNVSTAYLNLTRDPSYRDLVNQCMAESYMIRWWRSEK
ncbi:MAG: hypothetical protein QW816_05860 [Desulfurococcaceae archaeon]